MNDPSFLSLPELGTLLRSRCISAAELTGHFLNRLERLGPNYNAVVTVLREAAVAEARLRDRELAGGKIRGPLHGIPYGVKDLLATEGAPTTWGAEPYRNQMLKGDATVVRRLREAGAVLCAKLAMVELAGGMGYNQAFASFTGAGKTPWDLSRWSGGSSSGPGSAVGAGLVPFAIGSETWGSIQFPAAFCGVSGLRPTYGRVSRHGAMALSWTMDKLGPLARTAEDCGLILEAIAGPDPLDPTALAAGFTAPRSSRSGKRFRIGVLKGSREKTQPEVVRNFDASLAVLKDFADVVEGLELPDFPYDAAASVIIDGEAASAFEPLFETGRITELTAPEDRLGGYPGQVVLAKDYLRALRVRRPASRALDTLLAGVDAIVAPTLPTVAWPLDAAFDKVYPDFSGGSSIGGAANLSGVPGLFLMNGTGESGLPTSLQLTGRALGEESLVAIGIRYQERTGFHRMRPPGL
ncbi:MAG: aspartyl-tRNA(Asn)/glutamyl-tRNA(Gln) amidotransferase subunit [Gemmatimonadales bacterium]|nr:aspartyl-tRNA(Asn)/glutamyl-tRNA(Gln) amidotransferase subunit [Gemmatimonadales bacterium]